METGVIPVQVTCRSLHANVTARETTGYVPFESSPLAIVPSAEWNGRTRKWTETSAWQIMQRPTGLFVGVEWEWPTKEEAMAALLKLDPMYPAWALATGKDGEPATLACRVKFRGLHLSQEGKE